MSILGFFTLFRAFELSCFRDWFSLFIRRKRNQQEDHENTKTRKNAAGCASLSRSRTDSTALSTTNKTGTGSEVRGACPAFVLSNHEPLRISPHQLTAAGAIRTQCVPNFQRSIFVVRSSVWKSRRAEDVNPRILRLSTLYSLVTAF